jgi:hypothetical protein
MPVPSNNRAQSRLPRILLFLDCSNAIAMCELLFPIIGNKLRLHGSCQGDGGRSFKEKLVSVTLSIGERCDN